MSDDHYSEILKILQSRTDIPLRLSKTTKEGIERTGIRPQTDEDSFIIALTSSLSNFEATLIHDQFSADIIRKISSNISVLPSIWTELDQLGTVANYRTIITVDQVTIVTGDSARFEELPPSPWRYLEIECSGRVNRKMDPNDRHNEMANIAQHCMNFALLGLDYKELGESEIGRIEGGHKEVKLNKYERSRINRAHCINHFKCFCQVCGFDFEKAYGQIGEEYIQVHHKIPVSQLGEGYVVDPIKDLIPLCPNCHAMIHSNPKDPNTPFTPEELKEIMQRRKEESST